MSLSHTDRRGRGRQTHVEVTLTCSSRPSVTAAAAPEERDGCFSWPLSGTAFIKDLGRRGGQCGCVPWQEGRSSSSLALLHSRPQPQQQQQTSCSGTVTATARRDTSHSWHLTILLCPQLQQSCRLLQHSYAGTLQLKPLNHLNHKKNQHIHSCLCHALVLVSY